MSLIKNLKVVILVLSAVLILAIVRISDPNLFKEPVEIAISNTRNNGNLVTLSQLKRLTTSYLVIDLGNNSVNDPVQFQQVMHIPFKELLNETNRNALNEQKGAIVLYSEELTIASKAWIILNQLGYKNLQILSNEENPEALKYKFQPDTTARLEQDPME